MSLITRARVFATAAHAAVGQMRKYTNEPYIVHPAEVALLVEQAGGTDEMIAAAWLHDVIEDTKVPLEVVWNEFGPVVASYVHWLTDRSKPSDGNRAKRKEIDREHIRNAPGEVHTIKLADLISNTKSIVAHDPDFAKVYLKEKKLLLEVLTGGNPKLMELARAYIS